MRGRSTRGPRGPQGVELLCDVGCASFWYAAALEAFFRPRAMVGVDVEGYRLFKDGRTRSDYAAGYVGQRPNARFVVADYLGYARARGCHHRLVPVPDAARRFSLGVCR